MNEIPKPLDLKQPYTSLYPAKINQSIESIREQSETEIQTLLFCKTDLRKGYSESAGWLDFLMA